MNLKKLQPLISQGESDRLEFKNTTGQRTSAMKTVCGMLNGLGGMVLFGVSDSGKVKGQDLSTRTMEGLSAEISRIDPPAFPEVETIPLENGETVIALRITGGSGLYTYDGRPYIRSGPTTRVMPKAEYERRLMERLHATQRWENMPAVEGVDITDLDEDEIQLTLVNAVDAGRMDQPRKTDTRSVLTGLGLIVDDRLLNAAIVLYGKPGRLESMYPQCAIQLARFRGKDRLADFSDNRQYWGHAFGLLRRAESFLLDHMPIAGKVVSGKMKREDSPMYPPRAFREALANAFCHRDYAIPGASISIAMYDNRMEVINPGELHFGITPESLLEPHESRPWNPIIANVFYRAGIIERWGTGTLNIIDWCADNGNPRPEWSARAGSVAVTFLPLDDASIKKPESQPESRPESQPESKSFSLQDKVCEQLLSGELSRSEISARLGQKQISGQLKKAMRILIDEDIIAYTIPEKPKSRFQKYRLTEKGKKWISDKSTTP